ncbi:metaxin 1 [Entomortierella chlamydospora]|uniref:Metaxin 1 n=1 Tax=Entomortierella chlamydospora TaxID=101097 RepID=A0A9P6MMF7_9FUNG|nr:metaxin 1 [Entomortierella chlamydospora]KAG0007577.1 metaxin 1 [Entomortierella chlamydospora]
MADHEEQVTEFEPVVEFFDEVQPDGSIKRKKKTIRTKRILKSTTVAVPVERTTTTTTTTTSRGSSELSQHQEPIESTEAREIMEIREIKEIKESEETKKTEETEDVTESQKVKETKVVEHIQSSEKGTNAGSEESRGMKRTLEYRIFGEGGSKDHPLFRFLAKFPLKQSPAPHTRPRPVKAILYAYASGWKVGQEAPTESTQPNVGSFDTYLKFNGIEFELKPALEPSMSPSGKLPFLALSNGSFVTSDGFEAWVQENKDETATAELDLHEAAEAVAFISLAESKIHAALLYTLWFEPAHFYATTRQHYYGHHKWLLTVILSYLARSEVAHSMLLTRTQIDRELIFEEAASAIEALATQLGDMNEYFFGKSKPSSLDAVVFSYLHVILTLPRIRNADDAGRSGELASIVRKHENLYKYSQNIWKKWFAA